MGKPAVILSIQKQPGADTNSLTDTIENALAEIANNRPNGVSEPKGPFKQADFIEASIGNMEEALRDGKSGSVVFFRRAMPGIAVS